VSDRPTVTAIIPTCNRPPLVRRAVDSALAQTESRIEVLVVIDGPDPDTMSALASVADGRLRTIQLADRRGAGAARNRGIEEAAGRWVALLDDDDEWLPEKLATQLALAEASGWPSPIVSSRLIARTPDADLLLPRRLPEPGEPVSEYLTVRHHVFRGEGFLSTSTLLAPTELFRAVPFSVGLPHMQDLDWVLRASQRPDVGLECSVEPLTIRHDEDDRPRISGAKDWRTTFDWVTSNRDLFTPRAYAAALMGLVSALAAPTHDRRALRVILREAVRDGRPTALEYATFAQVWLIPRSFRHALRARLAWRSLRYRT